MKKIKASLLILLSGVLVTSGIVFAAPTTIQAFLQPDFRISIDNQIKYHPEGLQPIVYQDRTYLPAAFIAEQLGAEVAYDASTKTVSIDPAADTNYLKEIEEYKVKISDLEKRIKELENTSASSDFSKMPSRKTQNGYSVTLEGLAVSEENEGRLYFTIENKSVDTGMRIEPLSTKLIINGKEYTAGQTFYDSVDTDLFKWLEIYEDEDQGIYNEIESFVPFRDLPDEEDIKEITVTMVVQTNQYVPEKETVVFKVLND